MNSSGIFYGKKVKSRKVPMFLFISMVSKKGYYKDGLKWKKDDSASNSRQYVVEFVNSLLKELLNLKLPDSFDIRENTEIFLIADGEGARAYWNREHGFEWCRDIYDKHGFKMYLMKNTVQKVISQTSARLAARTTRPVALAVPRSRVVSTKVET